MLDYKTQADNDSMYNTPPTYAIYIAGLVFQWLQDSRAGCAAMEQHNIAKADAALRLPRQPPTFYAQPGGQGRPLADERALHAARTRALDEEFLKEAKARGLVQLKGHRSVGGMRASIYNAMPIEGVQALVELHEGVRAQRMGQANG